MTQTNFPHPALLPAVPLPPPPESALREKSSPNPRFEPTAGTQGSMSVCVLPCHPIEFLPCHCHGPTSHLRPLCPERAMGRRGVKETNMEVRRTSQVEDLRAKGQWLRGWARFRAQAPQDPKTPEEGRF